MAYNSNKSTQPAKFDRKDKLLVLLMIVLLVVTFPLVRSFYRILIPVLIFSAGAYLLIRMWRSASQRKENGEDTAASADWWNDFVVHVKDTLRAVVYIEIALLLLFLGATFAFRHYAKEKDTQAQLTKMSLSLAKYKQAHGRYPENLLEIIGNDPLKKEWLRDAWGNPVEYKVTAGGSTFVLRSAGPDGTLDTKDDLESRY